ncbi:MAG TPA: cytochrome c, partial [Candidatus Thermoplasmatota archaeon]
AGPVRRRAALAAGAVAVLAPVGIVGWDQLARVKQVTAFEDAGMNFKYGGLTTGPGLPYYLFAVLPDVFPDLIPGGGRFEAFGFVDDGQELPVGFARQVVGFQQVTPNCAMCHVATYRVAPDSAPVVVPGAPGSVDITAFNRFLWAVVEDDRYRASVLLPAIEARFDPTFLERLTYRVVLLPAVRRGLRKQKRRAEWQDGRPSPGRGRIDAFSTLKYGVLDLPDDGTLGTSDMRALWRMKGEEGHRLHWAGVSPDGRQVDYMSLYATNLGGKRARVDNFERVRSYLAELPPPAFPFPVDGEAAARGEAVFGAVCAGCHVERQGEVTPLPEIRTDPELVGVWTDDLRDALMAIREGPFDFSALERTDGYVSVRLDGLWMRAPYLHNGSVPTLRHLLEPAAARPVTFQRGSDVYDPDWMGFVWEGALADADRGAPYDTRLRGNGNAGHEYGVDLTPAQKRDLVEYLKTL